MVLLWSSHLAFVVLNLSGLQGYAQEVDVSGGENSDSGPTVEISPESSSSGGTRGLPLARMPLRFVVSLSGGYDDNADLRDGGSSGSAFSRASLAVSYSFVGPRFEGSLATDTSFDYYFDRAENPYRPTAHLDVVLGYAATERLSLNGTASIRYQSEPDISLNTFAGRQNDKFWYFSGSLAGSYQWLPRFSTVTTYSATVVEYVGGGPNLQSHFVNSLGNQARFLLLPITTLTGSYIVTQATYGSNGGDSLSQSALIGVDHTIGPHLRGSFQGGVQFYTTELVGGGEVNRTSPHFTSTLDYTLGSRTSVAWNSQYSIEASDFVGAAGATTFRTGLTVSYSLTARISATAGGYYRHNDYDGTSFAASSSQDAFDVSLGLSYSINRFLSATAHYERTDFNAGGTADSYSRNRYLLGLQTSF